MPSSFELAQSGSGHFDSMRHLGEGEAQLESAFGREMVEARAWYRAYSYLFYQIFR